MAPLTSGYWTRAPHTLEATEASSRAAEMSPILRSIPNPSARVLRTEMVCGATPGSTRNIFFFCEEDAKDMTIASAAAVASSRRDALAMCMPVREMTIVWKLTRDSKRPIITVSRRVIVIIRAITLGNLWLVRSVLSIPRRVFHDLVIG